MENGNRFPKAETPVTQKKTELPKRQANGEANGRPQHTPAQAAPPIAKGIYGHMGTGAGSLFWASGEISNFNPPGKGQRKAPTVSYSNGRKAQALSGAAMLEARTARLERLRQQRTHPQKVAAIICRGRFAHLSAGCRGRFGISRSNRGRGGCNAHSSTQRRGCSACV